MSEEIDSKDQPIDESKSGSDSDMGFDQTGDWSAYQKVESLFAQLRGIPEFVDAEETVALPSQIGSYEIQQLLGQGSFGNVYLGFDPRLERKVAIKVPRPSLLNEGSNEQFLREARTAAQLSHPNIVSIFEVAEEDGQTYIVSDYIDGVSMDQWSKDKPLIPKAAARLCRTISEAVSHAHEHQVIHRDLKPSNIMMDAEGNPFVMDFGLAKRQSADATMTMEGKIMGTPAYMSPEQARGDNSEVGGRADVYSLGVILFELLTGERPFRGSTQMLLYQVINEEAPDPGKLNSHIPKDLATICLKCLEKSADRRYSSVEDFVVDLGNFLENRPIMARPVGRVGRLVRWSRRRPLVAGLSAACVITLLAGTITSLYYGINASKERDRAVIAEKTAKKNESLAVKLRDEAKSAEAKARNQELVQLELRKRAVAAGEEVQHALYISDMQSIGSDWNKANLNNINGVLARNFHVEQPLSFEWRFWHSQCKQDLLTFAVPSGRLQDIAFSADGRYMAWVGQELRVWDSATGESVKTFGQVSSIVRQISFSPDGRRVAFGGAGNSVVILDLLSDNDEGLIVLEGHQHPVMSVVFHPSENSLVSACYDQIKHWDLSQLSEKYTINGHAEESLRFNQDGSLFVGSGHDPEHKVTIWNGSNGEIDTIIGNHDSFVSSAMFSHDGQEVITANDQIRIWSIGTGVARVVIDGHEDDVFSLDLSRDGKYLASGSRDRTVRVWELQSGREVRRIQGHLEGVLDVAFDNTGKYLGSTSLDNTVKVWEVQASENLRNNPELGGIRSFDISNDGKRVVTGHSDNRIRVLAIGTKEELLVIDAHSDTVTAVEFSSSGKEIVSSSDDGTVKVWSAHSGELIHTFGTLVERADWQAAMAKGVLPDHWVFDVAISPDGKTLASVGKDKKIKVWARASKVPSQVIEGHEEEINSVSFSKNGKKLATGGNSVVKIWDVKTGKNILVLKGHTADVLSVAFSPSGEFVASSSGDRTVRVWDPNTGEHIFTLLGHESNVNSLDFSPDGLRLAAGSNSGVIKLWELKSGKEVLSVDAHSDIVTCVRFSPDGESLISSEFDKDILKRWRASKLVETNQDDEVIEITRVSKFAQTVYSMEEAAKGLERLRELYPNHDGYIETLAELYLRLSYHKLGSDLDLNHKNYGIPGLSYSDKAILLLSLLLVKQEKGNTSYLYQLGQAYYNQASELEQLGKLDDASFAYQQAIENITKCYDGVPQNLEYPLLLVEIYLSSGSFYFTQAELPDAFSRFHKAIALQEQVATKDSHSLSRLVELSKMLQNVGTLAAKSGMHGEAFAFAERLVAIEDISSEWYSINHYNAACLCALAAASIQSDDSLSVSTLEELTAKYVMQSLSLLGICKASGLFNNPADLSHLKQDVDLQFLHGNKLFEEFLKGLE